MHEKDSSVEAIVFICFFDCTSRCVVFENNPVAFHKIAVLRIRGVQRSGDAWGNCLIVCPLPISSSEKSEKNKQYVKNSVGTTSFEKLIPCSMCK